MPHRLLGLLAHSSDQLLHRVDLLLPARVRLLNLGRRPRHCPLVGFEHLATDLARRILGFPRLDRPLADSAHQARPDQRHLAPGIATRGTARSRLC